MSAKKSSDKKPKVKKRARKDDDEEGKETPVYIAHEQRDLSVLGHIHELRLPIDVDRVVTAMYSEMSRCKVPDRTARTPVEYVPAEYKAGRLYGNGLQGVSGWIRRIIGYKFYHDVDIKNACPTILCQIAKRELGECPGCPAILEEYARDRSTVFARVRANGMPNASDAVLKTLFLVSLHGGKYMNGPGAEGQNPVLDYFQKAVRRTARKLWLRDAFLKSSEPTSPKQNRKIHPSTQRVAYFRAWFNRRSAPL
jgi:hypothetical protein